MKSYKVLGVSAALATLAFAGSASAQFGMPNLGGLGNMAAGVAGMTGNKSATGSGTAGTGDASTQAFMTHFGQAQVEVNAGQLLLAAAFGLKDQIALLEAEKTALSTGSLDAEGARKSEELSESVNAEITKRMESGVQLSQEEQQQYLEGFLHMVKGGVILARLVPDSVPIAQSLSGSMRSGNMLSTISTMAGTGVTAFKFFSQVPGFSRKIGDACVKLSAYAQANKIPVPNDATKALG